MELSEPPSIDSLQLTSGFFGALLSGAIMLVVLILTLWVQWGQHKDQIADQRVQFKEQQDKNVELLRFQLEENKALLYEQLKLERVASAHREILRLRTSLMVAILTIERIASTGKELEKFEAQRYEVIALHREVRSHLAKPVRESYLALADLQDRYAVLTRDLLNKGSFSTAMAENYALLVGQLVEWTDAYIDDDSEAIASVDAKVTRSNEALDNEFGTSAGKS